MAPEKSRGDLIIEFEKAIANGFREIGAQTSGFIIDTPHGPRFREGGMPSDWRSNFYCALKALHDLDAVGGEPWSLMARGSDLRETLLAVINAMKRGDDRSFKAIMKHAVQQWGGTRVA